MAAPEPSARLLRAVAAERVELERHRARMATEAGELRAALARIEHGLAEIDERRDLLDRLAPAEPEPSSQPGPSSEPDGRRGVACLRGPEIREVAVRVAIENGRDALHYREWYELLVRAGHAIAGKDPLAVFLTQITRSPAIRKGARAGVYELDRGAVQRLAREIDALQRELGGLPAAGTHDLTVIRERRRRLTTEIARAERALDEVARLLAPPASAAATR